MKKLILPLTLLGAISLSAFAEPVPVECSSDLSFGTESCEVCYTDTFAATETPDGFTSNITSVKIPWKHNGGALSEIIYDNEQKFPEIQSTLKVTTKPEKPEELWTNHESLVWVPLSDHKEVFIKKDEEIGLYKLQEKAGITVSGKKIDDTLMFITPLVVRDFSAETSEDSDPKTRNICVMGKFSTKTDISQLINPLTPDESSLVQNLSTSDALEKAEKSDTTSATPEPVLNSAGPEENAISADQTKTETGPALWISLLLAFALASAWNAWRRTTQ